MLSNFYEIGAHYSHSVGFLSDELGRGHRKDPSHIFIEISRCNSERSKFCRYRFRVYKIPCPNN